MRKTDYLIIAIVAALMLAGGYWFAERQRAKPVATETVADLTGKPLPHYRLGSLNGSMLGNDDFSGKVVLYNFWATWCAPCRKEMPALQRFHEDNFKRGFSVVGIAVDDVQAARDFAAQMGITYPILVGADDVLRTNRAFGNTSGALPFSVLVDREGVVRWWDWGTLDEKLLDKLVSRWL